MPKRAQYLRVITSELQRVASHLLWLGTWCLDMGGALGGGATIFLYCIRERELILDLFESLVGARLLYGFYQVGGVRYDVPSDWASKCRETVDLIDQRITEYQRMLEDNPFFLVRTQGVGVISRELAQEVGIAGPLLRGSGVAYDIRRGEPYSSYEDFEFRVPVETSGDCYARYCVRMAEFRESLKIVRQALDRLPEGPISSRPGLKSVAQTRIPKGEAYARVEGARGEVGCYLIADGSEVQPEWFNGAHTVGITAGASAPEVLVEDVIDALRRLGPVDVSEFTRPQETIEFRLPPELREGRRAGRATATG